jgi:hypothetical protein
MRSMATSNTRYAATADASLSAFNASERHSSGEHTIHGRTPQSLLHPDHQSLGGVDLTPGSVSPTGSNVSSGDLDLTR